MPEAPNPVPAIEPPVPPAQDWAAANETPRGPERAPVGEKPLDPSLILLFAKQIVLGCAVVGTAFAGLALVGPLALHFLLQSDATRSAEMERYILATGTSIMSVVTVVIPPLITLVLGFYFGRKHNQ